MKINTGKLNNKLMSKSSVKKNLRANTNGATFPHPQHSEDFHDDSSLRSLSSSFSGFSASVSRFDNFRSQDISILKVCKYIEMEIIYFFLNFRKTFQDTQNDIGILKIQLSEVLEESSVLKTR